MDINFPTPPKRNSTPTTTAPSEEDDLDNLTPEELKEQIRLYMREVVAESDYLDVDLSDLPIELSTKMKRTAGKVAHKRGKSEVLYVRFAWKAYKKWGWEQFASTVRHELIHVHQVQNYGKGGHGRDFKALARKLDTHRNCQAFSQDEAKYHLICTECDETIDYRYKRSKVVKNPERYNTKCCKAPLRVKHNR